MNPVFFSSARMILLECHESPAHRSCGSILPQGCLTTARSKAHQAILLMCLILIGCEKVEHLSSSEDPQRERGAELGVVTLGTR